MNFDLGHVARDLGIPFDSVQRTVQKLDEGNTVPFITRYRKDQTGGLDEEAIRAFQEGVARLRLLVDRKQTILKSIEAQGKLTPELANQINSADSLKRLEDLYLPFKPKKQTLATKAREQGLEPLALEVLNGDPAAADLEARAAEFVSAEKGLESANDVLTGVGYLVAEKFSERADVRGRLRRIMWRTGKLVSTRIEPPAEEQSAEEPVAEEKPPATEVAAETPEEQPIADDSQAAEIVPEAVEDGATAETVADELVETVADEPAVEPVPPAPEMEAEQAETAQAEVSDEPAAEAPATADEPSPTRVGAARCTLSPRLGAVQLSALPGRSCKHG
jgi:uncharacterized protein